MADDEEVVFKDSPVYTYLKESGLSDRDICPEINVDRIKDKSFANQQDWCSRIYKKVKQIIFTVRISSWSKSHHKQRRARALGLIQKVARSSALSDEDANVLAHLLDGLDEETSDEEEPPPAIGVLGGGRRFLVLGVACGLAALLHPASAPWSAPLFALTALLAVWAVRRGRLTAELDGGQEAMTALVGAADEFCGLERKAVRRVQEAELMSRGFTTVDNLSAVSRLERANLQTSQRRCPELRRVSFQAARGVMLICRTATIRLLNEHVLHNDLLAATSHLATGRLDDYGPCVTLPDDGDALAAATDNYCVTAIKAMVQLCRAHLSEYLRVITLVYLLPRDAQPAGSLRLSQALRSPLCELRGWLTRLGRCYALHDCSLLRRGEDGRGKEQRPAARTHSGAVYTAIHSLGLHLQAAYIRLHTLEAKLEPLCELDDPLPLDLRQQLTSDLKVIKANLSACDDCWESSNQLTEDSNIDTRQQTTEIDTSTACAQTEVAPSTRPECHVPVREPILEDQVFEVYTDPAEVKSLLSTDSTGYESKEEKVKRDRERREARRVLGELKRVIAARSAERRRALASHDDEERTEATVDDGRVDAGRVTFGLYGTINAGGDARMTRLSGDDAATVAPPSDGSGTDSSADDERRSESRRTQAARRQYRRDDGDRTDGRSQPEGGAVLPSGAELSFSASVAAMAVARSRQVAALSVDTFGDDSSGSESEAGVG